MKASSFPRNLHQRIRSSPAVVCSLSFTRFFRCSSLFACWSFRCLPSFLSLAVFSLSSFVARWLARRFFPAAFFAGFFVGGPKWTRTTDLTIISRAL